ncbi:MAG TPA: hypothetical protein ENK23_06745 [Sorangium sp.]|nr:hypothetical protein [Sorangium sp.]
MSPAAQLLCPRCRAPLFVGSTHDHVVHGCGYCGGVWLDAAASARVIKTACEATVTLARQAAQHARAEVDTHVRRVLPCPCCGGGMRTSRVQQAWLDIDSCDEHGVWYDRGELERVARTANIPVSDWRNRKPPPVQGSDTAFTTGASDGYEVSDVVIDVAGAVLFEGVFALLEGIFD